MGVCLNRGVAGTLAGVLFPVKHIGAGHLLLLRPHQGQFHLILDVFDMHLATGFQAATDGLNHLVSHPMYGIVDPGGAGGFVTLDGEEGFGHGNADLRRVETDKGAVAFDDLEGFGIGVRGWPGFGQG